MNPWHGAGPEAAIATAAYAAIAVAGYLVAGVAGAAAVSITAAAGALVATRMLLPQRQQEAARKQRDKPTARSISGYSHRRFVVDHATQSQAFYETDLRPVLEHILAAKLAEHHHTNLYRDPEAAKGKVGDDLWYWIDPAQSAQRTQSQRAISPRTLARLVDRLERL
jgi:hypothetical protein